MSETILRTKVFIPPLRPSLVARPRLIERMERGSAGKCLLVSAPAGFGKTTLVVHWLQQQNDPVGWLSLDENDNVPRRFFTYLLTAVQSVYPDLAQSLYSSLHSPRPPEDKAIMPTLVNELALVPKPLLLVLDDYHVIQNQVIHEALSFFIDVMPPSVYLIVTSREEPPLPLPRWRVRGQLSEIHASDLRFTVEEAAAFFAGTMGLQLDDTAVTTLEARTEGWAAGLQLAALSIRSTGDASAFINTFTGSDRQVADYLLQEVLFQQSEPVQKFLLQTSILERFNADLCNALLHQNNSQDILDELEAANLFLNPLDNHRFWYRYHHLFAQLLRYRLERDGDESAVANLHRRAAAWYESQNLLEEAVDHALHIPDYNYMAQIITALAPSSLFEPSGLSLFKQWAEALPETVIRSFPRVAILAAGAYLITGDLPHTQQYLKLIADDKRVAAEYNLFQSILVRNEFSDFEQALQMAQKAYQGLIEEDISLGAMAMMQVGVNHWNLGNLVDAEQAIIDMRRLLDSADGNILNLRLQAIHLQASIANAMADLYQAEQLCLEGVHLANQVGPEKAPMIGWTYALMGRIYYEWNEIEKAALYTKKAQIWAERTGISDIFTESILARINLACQIGDKQTAHQLIQEMTAYVKRGKLNNLITNMAVVAAHFSLRLAELDTAARWANGSGLNLDDEPVYHQGFGYQTLASIRLAEARELGETSLLPAILTLVEKLVAIGKKAQDRSDVINSLILKALALVEQGNNQASVAALDEALTLAEPGSLMRIFLDWGPPLQAILLQVLPQHPTYVGRLLHAFGDETGTAVTPSATVFPKPAIDLTPREMDVLQAIAVGLSNKEIEETLFISKNTVRTHIKNLYSKLGVESRTQAIARARSLNLI